MNQLTSQLPNHVINQDFLVQYNIASRRDLGKCPHVWWALDGIRSGTKDYLFVCLGTPKSKKHCWSAPQVRGSFPFTAMLWGFKSRKLAVLVGCGSH